MGDKELQEAKEKEAGKHAAEKKKSELRRQLMPEQESGKKLSTPRLAQVLEEAGLVNDQMVQDILTHGDESAQTLRRSLISQGLVREDDILDALSQELEMERIDFDDVKVTPELIEQINKKIAIKYKVFPTAFDDETITIAISDPLNIQTMDELEKIVDKKIKGVIAPEDDIQRAIKKWYEGDEVAELYEGATAELDDDEDFSYTNYGQIDIDADGEVDQPPVVKFVDMVFKQAIHEKSSDIHIEPTKFGLLLRVRVDGRLHEIPSPPKRWQNSIISRLKVMAGMDLAEKRIPQDGRIKLSITGKSLDLRVSVLPSIYGEAVVMRILDQASFLLGLEDVGFMENNIRIFKELIRAPNGVILMTGPTGSGKTTTLYAALSTLNTPETKIITIEDPVEYQIEGINQIQIDEGINLDFSRALRSVLRQSPDVLLVGEMRDLETAEIGIRAALTGHLVFSTLHTNDAPGATVRLINMGIKPFLVASSLQAVIAQRLIRRLCLNCRQEYEPHPEEIKEMGKDPDMFQDRVFYKAAGCERCNHTGYRGRTAIHEIFLIDQGSRRMIIRSEPAEKIKKYAVQNSDMRTLRMDGWEKVLLGITTIEEVMRITQMDEEIEVA